MKSFNHYKMTLRPRSELTTGLVLYGETEPAEMQIENLWKIVDRRTGEELADPRPDFDEFSSSDRMYPSMMKPEVKRRRDQKNDEWEENKAQHAKLRRMVHAQFMEQNPNLPVVQKLKQTTYGNEIQNEFKKHVNGGGSRLKPKASQSRTPQIGTGKSIRDELERDNVDLNEIADEVLQFMIPKTENTYAVLAVNRDENLRIEDKILVSSESSHVLEYQYDEGGRLQAVKYSRKPVEIYRYNQLGQRTYSHVSGSDKLEYQYNDLGQLVRAGDTTYTYDTDGDLSKQNSPEGITRYEYLKTGQLCEVHLPDGTNIEYRFDKRGFRTAKYINGQLVQKYQWKDLTTLTAVENAEGISKFHYNEHGRVMGMARNGQVFLFATDQLGSIFTVADSSGNSVHEILYDSFGRRVYNSDPEYDLALGFGGGLYDSDTGLIHFGYREYDPVIGRFISPDPLGYDGGDVDLYGYCLDDPINFVDRLGLKHRPLTEEEKRQKKEQEEEYKKYRRGNMQQMIWIPTEKQRDQIDRDEDVTPEPWEIQELSSVKGEGKSSEGGSDSSSIPPKKEDENNSGNGDDESEDKGGNSNESDPEDTENPEYPQEHKDRASLLKDALKSKLESMENLNGTPLEWGQVFNSIDNVKKQGKKPTVSNVMKDWGSSLHEFGSRIFKP